MVEACAVDKDLFASELVIRAERQGLKLVELPMALQEIRPPSVDLWRRVPRVLKDLAYLNIILRRKG